MKRAILLFALIFTSHAIAQVNNPTSSISTPVSVANGGTGAADAATGLSNLGGAATSAFNNFTTTTPAPTCVVGTATTISSSVNVQQVGKTAFINMAITLTTAGSCAGGFNITLPVTASSSGSGGVLTCKETVTQGTSGAGSVSANSNAMTIRRYDNSSGAWTPNGTVVLCSGYIWVN